MVECDHMILGMSDLIAIYHDREAPPAQMRAQARLSVMSGCVSV